MPRIHEVRWTDDEIAIIQVEAELLVCHMSCSARRESEKGCWMLIPLPGHKGWWGCAGTGCGFELFNDGTVINRAELFGATAKDLAWWVATWAGVKPSEVEVSIDG